jgi:hypothetical protein
MYLSYMCDEMVRAALSMIRRSVYNSKVQSQFAARVTSAAEIN